MACNRWLAMGGLIKCEPNPERDEGFARDVEEYMNYAQEHGLVGQWCVCALSLEIIVHVRA